MSEHTLQFEGLNKTFGSGPSAVHAVVDAAATVAEGEIVAVVGPSGGGKTTLLSMIGCLLTPTSGSIRIFGEEVTALSHPKRAAFRLAHVGFVFQSFNLLGSLNSRENIEIALNLGGTRGRAAHDRATRLLEMLGLHDRMDARPASLSGGEQQRLAVARALANKPGLILADEPTASLDSQTGRNVMEMLKLAVDSGEAKSLVVVTHDQRILDLVHRVLFIEDGRLRPGNAAELLSIGRVSEG